MDFMEYPHRRLNPLTGEWILVSPHRTKRPWQGQVEVPQRLDMPAYDPGCYLCPGNSRAGGHSTPRYEKTFVFDNDFSALLPDVPDQILDERDLLVAHTEQGLCRVVCFSPRHDLTLALMDVESIGPVVGAWVNQYEELGARKNINHVQIFENRGTMMGCSNPHPHGQIWADKTVPSFPAIEGRRQRAYRDEKGSCLLCDYGALEMKRGERVIFENSAFVALVPFWAFWPFETLILPKSHMGNITLMDAAQRRELADALHRMSIRFDNLFESSFPYSMGIHQEPTDGERHDEWHFHIHYYPPLLRSATVRKFMVGYEMMAMPQRDITAEQASERLRNCPERHYTERHN